MMEQVRFTLGDGYFWLGELVREVVKPNTYQPLFVIKAKEVILVKGKAIAGYQNVFFESEFQKG
jgi:hypothetical protein